MPAFLVGTILDCFVWQTREYESNKYTLLSTGRDQSRRISSLCLYWREEEERRERKLEMLTSTKTPRPSSFLSPSELDLFKIGGSRMPRATHMQVRGPVQPPRVCRVNTGEVGVQIPVPGPGTNISKGSSITFSKLLLFSKYTSAGVRSFFVRGSLPGEAWQKIVPLT